MNLVIEGLKAYYGVSQILFGIDFEIGQGEVVSLLGRNGMGKTTTVHSIMGLVKNRTGRILFANKDISRAQSHVVAKSGLGLVPEGRRIFPNLSVRENLIATASNTRNASNPWTLDRIIELFPPLNARLGNAGWQLSGGEQQMVAVGRALMTNPDLLVLDEATEGLAPLVRDQIWRCLSQLKAMRQSILVIDKNINNLLEVADRHIVIEKGRIVWSGTTAALRQDSTIATRYLGV